MSFAEYVAERSDGRRVHTIAGTSPDVAAMLRLIMRQHPGAEETYRHEAYGWCRVDVLMPEEKAK